MPKNTPKATARPPPVDGEAPRRGFAPAAVALARPVAQQLDSQLLEGSLDVDEYAATLLRQVSLEKALRDFEDVSAQLAQAQAALAASEARCRELEAAKPIAATNASDALGGDGDAHGDNDDTLSRRLAARYSTTSQLGQFVQALVKNGLVRRDEDTDWYASTFAAELEDLRAAPLQQRLAEEERARREQHDAFAAYEASLLAKLSAAAQAREASAREAAHAALVWEHASAVLGTRSTRARVFAVWRDFARKRARRARTLARCAEVRRATLLTLALSAWRAFALDAAKARFCERRAQQALARQVLRAWAAAPHRRSAQPAEQAEQLRAQAARSKVPALILAASKGMLDAVVALINEGNAVNMSERASGNTPLHAAAAAASADICEVLLENGAQAGAVNAQGETALHAAARAGDAAVSAALALLRHGADPNSGGGARTPLHLAVSAGAKAMVGVLLQYGARVDVFQGRSTLHLAASRADAECTQALLAGVRRGDMPLDTQGQSPLHAAAGAETDPSRVIALLVAHGASPALADASGQTPLHVYCQNALATADGLRLFGDDVEFDRQDSHGNAALHYACALHHRDAALALVRAGASVYLANQDGATPLDLESQGFAVELLRAIAHPPILSRAERATRDLRVCQVCRQPLALNIFGRRLAEPCRRCGRLCCHICAVDRALLKWSSGAAAETTPVKVCCHCSEILKGS